MDLSVGIPVYNEAGSIAPRLDAAYALPFTGACSTVRMVDDAGCGLKLFARETIHDLPGMRWLRRRRMRPVAVAQEAGA